MIGKLNIDPSKGLDVVREEFFERQMERLDQLGYPAELGLERGHFWFIMRQAKTTVLHDRLWSHTFLDHLLVVPNHMLCIVRKLRLVGVQIPEELLQDLLLKGRERGPAEKTVPYVIQQVGKSERVYDRQDLNSAEVVAMITLFPELVPSGISFTHGLMIAQENGKFCVREERRKEIRHASQLSYSEDLPKWTPLARRAP